MLRVCEWWSLGPNSHSLAPDPRLIINYYLSETHHLIDKRTWRFKRPCAGATGWFLRIGEGVGFEASHAGKQVISGTEGGVLPFSQWPR